MAAIMLKPLRLSGSLSDEFVNDGHEGDTLELGVWCCIEGTV